MRITVDEIRAEIDNTNLDEGASQEQWNTLLLASIANSLEIIADALTDRKDNGNAD